MPDYLSGYENHIRTNAVHIIKPQADRSSVNANPEPLISNHLELTDSDSLLVEASVTEYSDGITNRW